jgi:gluconokinase
MTDQVKDAPMVVVLMGVSGSGKTTIGAMLARELGWQFHDGDELHPEANRRKMHAGTPLNDEDRRPWLAAIRDLIARCLGDGTHAIVACSALKQSYRDTIVVDPIKVRLVFLNAPRELIAERLRKRTGHFFDSKLLGSQFDALEPPSDAIEVEASRAPEKICRAICARLNLASRRMPQGCS